MSLEQTIQDHTIALEKNTEALQQMTKALLGAERPQPTEQEADAVVKPAKPSTKKEESEKKPDTKPTTSGEPSASTGASSSDEPTSDENTVVDYEAVKKAVLEVAKANRDEATAVLQRFGVSKISALKEDQYAACYQLAQDVLAGTASALAATVSE